VVWLERRVNASRDFDGQGEYEEVSGGSNTGRCDDVTVVGEIRP
jgi:hypothetical protein